MPDYFVPYDTSGLTQSFVRLRRSNIIYRFALQYADIHREALSAFSTAYQISDYLEDDRLLMEIMAYAKKKGVSIKTSELKESKNVIVTQAKAFISRNLLDNEGFYPIIQRIDNTLEEALNLIESQ